jgi:tripartite-type tricarboxylate transporter receptor subunit TctC
MKKWIVGAVTALMTLAGPALAEGHGDYPDRPIMLMVSYGAGGATDFQARIVTMTAGNY